MKLDFCVVCCITFVREASLVNSLTPPVHVKVIAYFSSSNYVCGTHPCITMMHFPLGMRLLLILAALSLQRTQVDSSDLPSLRFSEEPPSAVEFLNTDGATIGCAAIGNPPPIVSWKLVDGSNVSEIPKLRHVTFDGKLIFHPFQPENYRPDVHSTVYRCIATSNVGVIRSADIAVKGVVNQDQDAQVYDAYAIEGSAAVFKCHIPPVLAKYLTVIGWVKNDNLLIENTLEEGDSDKYGIMPTGELHVRDVTKADSGARYKCKTVNRLTGLSKVSSNSGQLFVTESRGTIQPRILESAASVTADRGQTAILACVAQSHPQPSVKWHKKTPRNQLISLENNKRFVQTKTAMIIKNVDVSDEGIYVCKVSNDYGKSHLDVTLMVTETLSAVAQPPVRIAKLNDKVVFKCDVTGHPITSVAWLHNGVLIDETNGEELMLQNLQMLDRGIYQCIAKNNAKMVQATAELRFSEIPPQLLEVFEEKTIDPGLTITMHCIASGIPQPSFIWNLDGMPLTGNSKVLIAAKVDKEGKLISSLTLQKPTVKDGGLYSCVAENNDGRVEHFSRINIHGPLGSRKIDEQFGISGGNIMLNCPVYGYPIDKVMWKKDGKGIPFTLRHILFKNNSLIVTDVNKLTDSGSYTCLANNRLGQNAEAIMKVEIMVPPKIVPFEFQDDLLREGMRARLQCVVASGDLPLKVSWLKDGQPIPPQLGVIVRVLDEFSSILTISSIIPNHNGKYTCVASNRAATATYSADLSVNVLPKIVPFRFVGEMQSEGSPARVVCGLQEGDPPVAFSWLHDDVPVKADGTVSIHEVDGLSSILSIKRLSPHHSGTYTCLAANKAGVCRHATVLGVNVPPKIVPFSFQEEHLVEGLLARVSCVVSRGDLPLKFHWEKDGVEMSPGAQGVHVRSFDEHSSILSITSVTSDHNGLYTCIADNAAGMARHSAQLVVKVPPRWIIEPTNVAAVRGRDVLLNCLADGFPKPTVAWMQAKGATHDSVRKDLHHGANIQLFSNGSLLLLNINSADEGYYFCKASNGIGSGLSAAIEVRINAPPFFSHMPTKINASIGEEVLLQCLVQGDTPIKIMWYKDGKVVQEVQEKHKIQTTNTASDALSSLTIKNISKGDHGNYMCFAENAFGSNKTSTELTVKGLPDPPSDPKVPAVTSTTVELEWKSPFNGNDPIKKYIIQYKNAEDSWDSAISMETVNGEPTSSFISHLIPATHYLFRLFAENSQGRSSASSILQITTNDDVPSGPPDNVQVEPVNTETFKVIWTAPDEKLWNGKIQGFYVGYKEVDTEDPYLYKTLLTQDAKADNMFVQIGGLKQFTKYAVVVQAYNTQGKGPESEQVVVMTSEGAPSLPPTEVRCTTLTSQSIHVTWTAPPIDSVNGILRGYKVVYKHASNWFEDVAENYNITLPTSMTIAHLEKFSNYSVQVMTMTKAGEGPRSAAIFCKTLDDVPGSPVDIKTIATSDDSVMVAWKSPDSPNGVLRSYTIYWKNSNDKKDTGSHTTPARESSYEVTGLKKGKRYEFWITALTMAGEGSPSRIAMQTPSGPTVAAKVVSFDEKIITAWKSAITLSCHAVGLPEPQKKWMWNGKSLDPSTKLQVLSDGTLSISDIQEEDGGDFSCLVENDFGHDKITYSIIVLAPPSAPNLEVVSVTSNTMKFQWKIPSSKMSRIKGYTLHTRRDVGEWKETTLGSEMRSYRLNNLDCGTRYEVYMTAFNKIGFGAPSEILTMSTNGSVPAPPTKADLIEEMSTSTSLYLNTWKSNGCPILYYMVEYCPKSTNEWTFVSNSIKPEQRRLVIPGLKPGTWYSLRMTAHNNAGSSISEYNFATLTMAGATVPPDLLSDSANDPVEGLLSYLNFYVIVPIACTVIILLAILAISCFYIKFKGREHHVETVDNAGKRMSAASGTLKRGNSSESFAYMQRGTANKSGGRRSRPDDDLAPYATFQLANQSLNIGGRNLAPPLPPPRMEEFHNSVNAPMNPQFFASGGFMPGQHVSETTFVFPNPPVDHNMHFPSCYPQEAIKMHR